jgi:hypothetical protein
MSKLLLEFPYILLRGNTIGFDLELEKFIHAQDRKGCIEFIQGILAGKKFIDKYGDVFKVQNIREREELKKILMGNFTFNRIMQKLGISTHKLFHMPLGSFKEYHESMVAGPGGVFGNTGGEYAPGDARVPKVLGAIQTRPAFNKKLKKKKRGFDM